MIATETATETLSITRSPRDCKRDVTAFACCRHCGRAKVNRPRGLCWSCYYTVGVKERYPSTSKFANRGIGNVFRNAVLPPIPTTAAPGTPEKMAVLEMRARMGQALWHPLDACYQDDPRPMEWLRKARLTN
ncbi:hypothetical protein BH11PLA2_BH11PLA2_09510 [soil metagenome]